jgi:uncharacterized protein (UPF0212 family)
MDCRVVVEAAVPVYDVGSADEAVRIAISKTGDMLNPDLNYVEIETGKRSCPHCGESMDPAFLAADESLVALELEMTVFNVERNEHASRIARKEIGQRLENIPLEVLDVEQLPDDDEADGAADEEAAEEPEGEAGEQAAREAEPEESGEERATAAESVESTGADEAATDDTLPEFEELIDE